MGYSRYLRSSTEVGGAGETQFFSAPSSGSMLWAIAGACGITNPTWNSVMVLGIIMDVASHLLVEQKWSSKGPSRDPCFEKKDKIAQILGVP